MKNVKTILLGLICAALFSGCAMFQPIQHQGVSSSLVDYLYPDGNIPANLVEDKPMLELPLRIGLAFIPPSRSPIRSEISDKQKNELLEQVKTQFEGYNFIEHITVIPDNYLKHKRGFTTVEQIARLYGVDIIALVSYDQVLFTKNNISSLTYLTVASAFIFPGDEQRVDTFVDTAVFDVRTRKLLFRAPGIDSKKDISRLFAVESERIRIKQESFASAISHMSGNLDIELNKFKERVKQGQIVKVKVRNGYSKAQYGGGAFDGIVLLGLALLLIVQLLSRNKYKHQIKRSLKFLVPLLALQTPISAHASSNNIHPAGIFFIFEGMLGTNAYMASKNPHVYGGVMALLSPLAMMSTEPSSLALLASTEAMSFHNLKIDEKTTSEREIFRDNMKAWHGAMLITVATGYLFNQDSPLNKKDESSIEILPYNNGVAINWNKKF